MLPADHQTTIANEDMCRFLAACYYQPGVEFSEEHMFDSLLQAAQRIDPALAGIAYSLGEAFAAQDLQDLLVDYTRLFLGPGEALARPYGSFWLSGEKTVMQESTLAVIELYRQSGFELDAGFHEVPDHVAVELELLYLLTFSANQAEREGNTEQRAEADRLQRQLLDEHLGAWIERFAAAVQSGAETAFYRRLAELTERFVRIRKAGVRQAH
jgi:putative dimethyl sulfoxide reductase chaperone